MKNDYQRGYTDGASGQLPLDEAEAYRVAHELGALTRTGTGKVSIMTELQIFSVLCQSHSSASAHYSRQTAPDPEAAAIRWGGLFAEKNDERSVTYRVEVALPDKTLDETAKQITHHFEVIRNCMGVYVKKVPGT